MTTIQLLMMVIWY